MARKRYKPEEIVAKLRQVDLLTSQGQSLTDAVRQIGRRINHHEFVRQVFLEGLALWPFAGKPVDMNRLGHGLFGGQFVLCGRRLGLFEAQGEPIEQPRGSLGLLTVKLTQELRDVKLLMGDQGTIFDRFGARDRQFGRDLQRLRPLRCQRCFQGDNVIGRARCEMPPITPYAQNV